MVVYTESGKNDWNYFTLVKGDTTSFWTDADNFCVYRVKDRALVLVVYAGESADIWRFHDGSRVAVKELSDDKVAIKLKFQSQHSPHHCVGHWTPLCFKDKSLKRDSAGLNYPSSLPGQVDVTKSQKIKL